MKVQDVMQAKVISVRPDTSVREVARLLTEHHIRSVPVVDDQQRVIGIISESDLFLKEKGIPFSAAKLPTLFEKWVEPKQLEEIYKGVTQHTADEMTEDVVCRVQRFDQPGCLAPVAEGHPVNACGAGWKTGRDHLTVRIR